MTILFQLDSDYQPAGDQPAAIELLNQGLSAGIAFQTLLGVTGSGKTFTMAQLIHKQQRPTMILAHNKTLAAQLYSEMKGFFPNNAVEYFVSYYDYYQPEAYVPASNTYIAKDASINEHIEQMRLSATKALLERRDVIIVCTVSAIYGLGDPQAYFSMVLHLARGDTINQRDILKRLTDMQYSRNDYELKRGTYRVRGDLIDIYPADSDKNALRIELFDDTIEDLSEFDPLTGQRLKKIIRTTVYPKTHYVTPREKIVTCLDAIRAELKERLAVLNQEHRLVEAQRLEERTQYDLEMMNELGYCSGIENYSRYLSGRAIGAPPPTLFDYLPAEGLLFIDESHATIPQLGAMYLGDRSRKENLVNYGFRLPSALDNRPLQFAEFLALCPQTVFVSATPGPYELNCSDTIAEQIVRPTGLLDPIITIRPATSQVDDLMSEIRLRVQADERVLVTTLTKKMAEDLSDYFSQHQIKVRYLHADVGTVERVEIIRDLRLGKFDVLIGINLLREGLDMPEVSLVAILDADKEGFLRSERSLMQTIGRAARHLNGQAILYADKITPAMKNAIDETDRRRGKQALHNHAHGIVPTGIQKSIKDILEVSYEQATDSLSFGDLSRSDLSRGDLSRNQPHNEQRFLDRAQVEKHMKKVQSQMLKHAKNLEFEQAARCRDELAQLTKLFIAS